MSDRDRGRRFDYADFRPPIRVAGGIRARSQRGEIGRTWWSKRFLDALERYYGTQASRLTRGRAYARAGQVVRIDLAPGIVGATVQGSRPRPYSVTITVRELDDEAWTAAETAMAGRAVFLARLLAGEMPDEIEEAFEAAKVALFPGRRGDLKTSCTCPDTANPCKHTAAVYYLLAESFDETPFLIFEWRGRPRDRLVTELRALRSAAGAGAGGRGGAAGIGSRVDGSGSATTVDRRSVAGFWDGGAAWAEVPIDARPTSPPDALLRDADPEVVAALDAETIAGLRRVYLAAAAAARRRLDGSGGESTPELGRRGASPRGRARPRPGE